MYLTNISEELNNYGFSKVLTVRRELIHIKHIFTEIFVRKSIDIEKLLSKVDWSLFRYMEFMTNRIRKVNHFSRDYKNNLEDIVKQDRDKFFPTIDLYKGLNVAIVLDFDGVITKKSFGELYYLCFYRTLEPYIPNVKLLVCSANPDVNENWFRKNKYPTPDEIYACRGKIAKMKQLAELSTKYDYVFYIDNEVEYLEWAWIIGVQTYHYTQNKIKYFTLKTK